MTLRAILFDVDGTLAETEEFHRAAFNAVFARTGLGWNWDRTIYRELLTTTGGKERMVRHARDADPARLGEVEARLADLHAAKNRLYADQVATNGGALRPGVRRLIDEAEAAGVACAVVTTTSRPNIEALLAAAFGERARDIFATLVVGEDVQRKKPDPEAYRIALERLRLPAAQCVAIEDSRNGLTAARAAGLATLVTPSLYTSHEDFSGAALVVPDLERGPKGPIGLADLEALL